MKKTLFILLLISCTAMFAVNPPAGNKINVYYFHFTQRCMTCRNVENESKKAVETLYPEKVKNGEVTFQSLNLDEKTGEDIGKKYNIEGQTLIVISGDKRIDLTEKGFLYANNSPDKLKEEIRKAIDSLLK